MTVFTVTVYMQNYTLTSKQSNKHILIVVKCLQLSTNNILVVLLKLHHRSKDTYTHKDCVRLKRVISSPRIYTNSLVSMKE